MARYWVLPNQTAPTGDKPCKLSSILLQFARHDNAVLWQSIKTSSRRWKKSPSASPVSQPWNVRPESASTYGFVAYLRTIKWNYLKNVYESRFFMMYYINRILVIGVAFVARTRRERTIQWAIWKPLSLIREVSINSNNTWNNTPSIIRSPSRSTFRPILRLKEKWFMTDGAEVLRCVLTRVCYIHCLVECWDIRNFAFKAAMNITHRINSVNNFQ